MLPHSATISIGINVCLTTNMADLKGKERLSFGGLLKKAAKASFRGGIPGAAAMILNVVLLMWLRTAINYQYRHGGSIGNAFRTLYEEGGVRDH